LTPAGGFSIGSTSGVVQVATATLDREVTLRFSLEVIVKSQELIQGGSAGEASPQTNELPPQDFNIISKKSSTPLLPT
jgi:hypothetical protein